MPAASPRASSRPPACSPSLTKNLLPPPSSPLKKQGKARWIHTKARIFAGSETASGEGKTGARQSLSRCFSLYLLLMSFSCQIVLNIIKISNKSSFVQTLFIIFAVFNHIEHGHIIEQAKKMKENSIIINQALEALKASLPVDDVVTLTSADRNSDRGYDAILNIMGIDFVCYIKENITKTTLNPTLAAMQAVNDGKHQILLVTRYVTPRLATELANKSINYLDCAGNCLVRYTKRGKMIFQISNQGRKSPEPQTKTYPVFQEAGLKVVFYLLQNAENVNNPYREIKEQTNVSLGSVKNVLDELARRGFVFNTQNGRSLKDKKQLLDLWVSNYNEVLKPKLLMGTMSFRTEEKRNNWQDIALPQGMAWGGEPAANLADGYLQPGSFDIYTKSPAAHLMRTGAVKQDLNGEIHLYKKFWNEETDNKTVPAILIYADLMGSGNSRCLEAAQRILENELKDFE